MFKKIIICTVIWLLFTGCGFRYENGNTPLQVDPIPTAVTPEVTSPETDVRPQFKTGTPLRTPFGCEEGRIRGVDC